MHVGPSSLSCRQCSRVLHVMRFHYTRFHISVTLFRYHDSHQYPIRGKIFKPAAYVDTYPGLSGNAIQLISLALKNCGPV